MIAFLVYPAIIFIIKTQNNPHIANTYKNPSIIAAAILFCQEIKMAVHNFVANSNKRFDVLSNTTFIIYLFIIKSHDEIVPLALVVLTYKKYLTSLLMAAILCTNAMQMAAFIIYSLVLYMKPCDRYTLAVIVSVLIRLFLVTLNVIFNVLQNFILNSALGFCVV